MTEVDIPKWVLELQAEVEALRVENWRLAHSVVQYQLEQGKDRAENEALRKAIIAMAEDGWLAHGAEGMSEAQELCLAAYRAAGPGKETP